MLQGGTLLLYCTVSWWMGRSTAHQTGGEGKHWLCHAAICCRTHWTSLNTVLMQEGGKPSNQIYLEWFGVIPSRENNQSCDEGHQMPSIPGPGTVPAGGQAATSTTWTLWFCGQWQTLLINQSLFHLKGNKSGRKHAVSLKIRAPAGEVCTFCLKGLRWGSL